MATIDTSNVNTAPRKASVGFEHQVSPRSLANSSFVPKTLERSETIITISGDSLKHLQELQKCDNVNCAFGWMTYVANYNCSDQVTTWNWISLHKLLHEDEEHGNTFCKEVTKKNPRHENPFKNLRHVHLPANNMKWVEDLICRYYHTQKRQHECQVLRSNFWTGQQHGKLGPIHAKFMRPRCDMIPGDRSRKATHRDFVICMPYLHWEFDESREEMYNVIKDIEAKAKVSGYQSSPISPISPIELLDNRYHQISEDEQLLRKHLLHEPPLHIRRTLDQSYYWTLKDTQVRDRDQVVFRATKHEKAQIVMVDQLWLWILDGKVVITSFPTRWGTEPKKASGIYRIIRQQLEGRPDLENVYDMATLMMDQCSRFFFDRMVPKDNRPQVIDIFANAIGDITDKSITAYTEFWNLISPKSVNSEKVSLEVDQQKINALHTKEQRDHEEHLLKTLLNINPEGELLKEIKDVLDELHMMTKVFSEQYTVVQDYSSFIQKLPINEHFPESTRVQTAQLAKAVSRRKAEVHELTRAAERTADGLKELLDLKQKHANIYEARSAVSRTEESNQILRATRELAEESKLQTEQGVKQAKEAADQNRSILIFTMITIVFLPLGFFSSVFGMNAVEFGQGAFPIWKQILIMMVMSIFIISVSLSLALNDRVWRFFVPERSETVEKSSQSSISITVAEHDEESAKVVGKSNTI